LPEYPSRGSPYFPDTQDNRISCESGAATNMQCLDSAPRAFLRGVDVRCRHGRKTWSFEVPKTENRCQLRARPRTASRISVRFSTSNFSSAVQHLGAKRILGRFELLFAASWCKPLQPPSRSPRESTSWPTIGRRPALIRKPVPRNFAAAVTRGVTQGQTSRPGHRAKGMAHRRRFELLTPRFVVWCSIQLSYRCARGAEIRQTPLEWQVGRLRWLRTPALARRPIGPQVPESRGYFPSPAAIPALVVGRLRR
jgi:hypothetical protein